MTVLVTSGKNMVETTNWRVGFVSLVGFLESIDWKCVSMDGYMVCRIL